MCVYLSVCVCVCVDVPIFRSPLLKLCLLVTTAYCIRITIVFYVDPAVGLTGGTFEGILNLPGLQCPVLQDDGVRLDL